jgi:hypothetical protein
MPLLPVLRTTCVVVFLFGACVLGSCGDQPGSNRDGSEQIRVRSPNGQLDAVLMIFTYGGAAGGGVDSNIYIVPRGAQVVGKPGREILTADPMSGVKLVWKRDHLLEIHYDIAYIRGFRNLWGLHEIADTGDIGQRDFEVEIQLVPDSDASALKPDGTFRRLSDR